VIVCLGEVGRVLGVDAGAAEVLVGSRIRRVSRLTLDDAVVVDDWVQIHSGFALARLTAEQAREAEQIRTTPIPEELS
jgi:hydrogenase maturation factor